MTNLVTGEDAVNGTSQGISSLMDTWLSLTNIEVNGERNRGLYVVKSRGMSHSNQMREFLLTDDGIRLVEAYIGPAGMLTGSARLAQEAAERREAQLHAQEIDRRRREIARRRAAIERQITDLQMALEGERTKTCATLARPGNGAATGPGAADRRRWPIRRRGQ